MRRICALAVFASVLLLGMAGCGGGGTLGGAGSDDDSEATDTTDQSDESDRSEDSESTRTTRTTTSTTTTTTASTTTVPETTTTPSEPDIGPEWFSLPSGNIACMIGTDGVRCDIGERDWEPPARPADCQLDYGHALVVGANSANFLCAGDTALGATEILDYGQVARRWPYICESAIDGVRCHHTGKGHGFHLSQQSWDIFICCDPPG